MTSETAPRKYAAALLRELAPADTAQAVTALTTLAQVMEKVPAIQQYAAHPQIERRDKEALLHEILKMVEAPELVQRFAVLLLDQGELKMVSVIAKSLQSELDQAQGVQAVDVSSAAPLSEAQKKRLMDDLAKRLSAKLRINFSVDPALLGGIVVRTDNRVLDGSVQGRLNNLREKLLAD